jgi:hypothetical protein
VLQVVNFQIRVQPSFESELAKQLLQFNPRENLERLVNQPKAAISAGTQSRNGERSFFFAYTRGQGSLLRHNPKRMIRGLTSMLVEAFRSRRPSPLCGSRSGGQSYMGHVLVGLEGMELLLLVRLCHHRSVHYREFEDKKQFPA